MAGQQERHPDLAAMERLLDQTAGTAAGVVLHLAWLQGLTREEIGALTWEQAALSDGLLCLPDRDIPLNPAVRACLEAWGARRKAEDVYVLTSSRTGTRLPPESISRLARTALDAGGLNGLRLQDLRGDFVRRQLEAHDWPYVVRVSGMTVSTLQARYARGPQPQTPSLDPRPPRAAEIDEFKLWKLLQAEGSTPAGLALWLTWQLGLQAQEILALTWDQVDLTADVLRLPERTVPLTNALRRLLRAEQQSRRPEDDPHVLLTPNSRRPIDLPRLSRLVRTVLIRGGMEDITLRDLRRDEGRQSEDTLILAQAAEQGCISRSQVMDLLGLSRSAAYDRLHSLTERKKLVLVGGKYYPAGSVVPPEEMPTAIRRYLLANGSAYRQDIAGLLRVGQRQCAAILRRMVAAGILRQERQRYYLPEDPSFFSDS